MDINMAACDSERKPLPTAANSEPSRPASTVESGSRRSREVRNLSTGKNNRFPFLDILGYLKKRQVPTREFPTRFPGWDLPRSSKFGIFVGIL